MNRNSAIVPFQSLARARGLGIRPRVFARGMKAVLCTCWLLAAGAPMTRGAEEFLDRVEDALTWSALEGRVRTRLSGTLDLEGYDVQLPALGLIHTAKSTLFNPRLSVFLDAQLGSAVYVFVQSRVDHGFDPGAESSQVRLDEYALRITPWTDGRFTLQLGKFASVVGNWMARHGAWSNPFITAPVPYENLTGVWDSEAVLSSGALLRWSHMRSGLSPAITAREKLLRVPILWGPAYATGAAVAGELGKFRYAFEVKHASLSSRPEAWSRMQDTWSHPTLGGRIGYRPNEMWDIGLSASGGSYLRPFARRTLATGHGRGDYRELVLGQDVGFAWHHLQVWTEIYAARFEIPVVGDADTLAYYAEAKYKFTPQFFGALRWNQQLFATIQDRAGPVRWGQEVWRVDVAAGYRLTPHAQVKLQYSLQHGDSGPRDYTRTLAAQLTLRF